MEAFEMVTSMGVYRIDAIKRHEKHHTYINNITIWRLRQLFVFANKFQSELQDDNRGYGEYHPQ